jgi:hypothetical protein
LIAGTDRIPAITHCAKITEVRPSDNIGAVSRLKQKQVTSEFESINGNIQRGTAADNHDRGRYAHPWIKE